MDHIWKRLVARDVSRSDDRFEISRDVEMLESQSRKASEFVRSHSEEDAPAVKVFQNLLSAIEEMGVIEVDLFISLPHHRDILFYLLRREERLERGLQIGFQIIFQLTIRKDLSARSFKNLFQSQINGLIGFDECPIEIEDDSSDPFLHITDDIPESLKKVAGDILVDAVSIEGIFSENEIGFLSGTSVGKAVPDE